MNSIYICLVAITVVTAGWRCNKNGCVILEEGNAAASIAEKPVMSNDNDLNSITHLHGFLSAISENENGEENCETDIDNLMDLFDNSLSFCTKGDDGNMNCMNKEQYKQQVLIPGCGQYKETHSSFVILETKTNYSDSYQPYTSSIYLNVTWILIAADHCKTTRTKDEIISYNAQGLITKVEIFGVRESTICPYKEIEYESQPKSRYATSTNPNHDEALMRITDLYDLHDEIVEGQGWWDKKWVLDDGAGAAASVAEKPVMSNDNDLVSITHLHGFLSAIAENRNGEENCQTNIDNLMDLYDESLSYCVEGDYGNMKCLTKEESREQIAIPECGRYKEADSSFVIQETKQDYTDSYQSYTSSIHLKVTWTLTATDLCKTTRTQNEIISYNARGLITKLEIFDVKEFRMCPKEVEYESEAHEYQQDDDGRLLQNLVVDAPVDDDPLYGGYTKVTNTEQFEYIKSDIVKLEAEIRKYKDFESMSLVEAYYKYISEDRIRHRCLLEYVGPLPPAVTHEDGSITRFGPPLSIGYIEYDVVADKDDRDNLPKLIKMEREKEKGYNN